MKTYAYLGEYTTEEIAELNDLLHSSISNLPFTLSHPIEKLYSEIQNKSYGRAMNYALDFFEISIQYVSCLLIAYIQKEEESHHLKHDLFVKTINKIDAKRPLSFGDWINEIITPLMKVANERMPDNKLVMLLNKHLFQNEYNALLGRKNESSVVQIRNEYKGHGTTLSDDIYKNVVTRLEDRLFRVLKAVSPLQEFSFFSCEKQISENEFDIFRFNGHRLPERERVKTDTALIPHHYYVNEGSENGVLLDLFPLLFCNEDRHVYVFQSLKDEKISYISSHHDAETFISNCWNSSFDNYFQKIVPAFDISKELNWNEIQEMSERVSRRFTENAYKEKKYNQELFVDRQKLSGYFSSFRASDKTLFPLLGEAGQGKTNQLCFWVENLIKENRSILIFNSSGFSDATLEEKLKTTFLFPARKPLKRLLDRMHHLAVENNEKIYIFFDAINECLNYKGADEDNDGALYLFQDIRSILVNEEYTHFKILFTCRNYTWKNLIQAHLSANDAFTFHTGDEDEIAIHGFTNDELEKAYEIYRELYQMDTPFVNLSQSSTIRLKDPLVLKIACTNYLGEEFPDSVSSYTSMSLFEKMVVDISNSYAGNRQCSILKKVSLYILDQYEKGMPAYSISMDLIQKAYNDEDSRLHSLSRLIYKKEDISVAYGELLNKPERPILRFVESDNGQGQLQFIYERFLEYMLARVFSEREVDKLNNKNEHIKAETFIDRIHIEGYNVVLMGAMRNALIIDYLRTNDLSLIIQLIEDFGDDYKVVSMITETLNVLIRENYEKEVFGLMDRLLERQLPDADMLINRFNYVNKKIEANEADDRIIKEHNVLYKQLTPIIRLRKLASVSVFNGIFLTDYFKDSLYSNDPFRLLFRLMSDPINDVRNDTCLYLYYLSNKKYTLDNSLLTENITQRVVHEIYRIIKDTPRLKILLDKNTRKRSVILLESATRLCTLLMIDIVMSQKQAENKRVEPLLNEIREILKYLTANFNLIRIMMPFFQIILRRQITFQSIYVNNAIEYQSFWDDSVVPRSVPDASEWSKERLKEGIVYVHHYNRYYKENKPSDAKVNDIPDFSKYQDKILSAYKIGDSFSYFALERIMVVMGTCSWSYICPIANSFFTDEYRSNQWFDYSQMSMLYVLFQISVNSKELNDEIIFIYSRECEDWTRRNKGLFKARNSHKANPTRLYKRNIMNWYCVVYCQYSGDGVAHTGDERCVPVFYKLIDEAIATSNKELLYHLIENISELVSDFGYISTALALLKYILQQLDSVQKVNDINKIQLDRNGIYQDDLSTLIGKVLGTAKNYFPAEVDNFIKKEMFDLKFPGIEEYRAEILNYTPSGESLSDLFTHKFGNFLMWSILNEESVDNFAQESMAVSVDSSDCLKWFDQVVRILFKYLFNVKL